MFSKISEFSCFLSNIVKSKQTQFLKLEAIIMKSGFCVVLFLCLERYKHIDTFVLDISTIYSKSNIATK